jgi:hypothetical protein
MNKQFIPYEQALELKQLGFNEHCFGEWQNLKIGKNLVVDEEDKIYDISVLGADIKAPLYQQAFRWFREKYNLKSCIMFRTNMEDNKEYYDWLIKGQEVVYRHFNTYEEAELDCLKQLIEIVKNK